MQQESGTDCELEKKRRQTSFVFNAYLKDYMINKFLNWTQAV